MYWMSPAFVDALDQSVIAIMIEKESAVENLEQLLSVEGVDMVQFGPADYSMSLGIPGQYSDPRVVEAERYVIETSLKMGVAPRAEIAHPDQASRYLDMGVKHFCVGTIESGRGIEVRVETVGGVCGAVCRGDRGDHSPRRASLSSHRFGFARRRDRLVAG